jgi:VIT1/CCC1 family predicted Fe2+/Mn2+ transporter
MILEKSSQDRQGQELEVQESEGQRLWREDAGVDEILARRTVAKSISKFAIAIAAALFPVFSMVALYFVKRTLIRLLILVGLTVGFALAVKATTTAKSTDIFAIAVAYVLCAEDLRFC